FYWWATQNQVKNLSMVVMKKDETIRFLSQENLNFKKQVQDVRRQNSLEISNLNQQLQIASEDKARLQKENEKQKDLLRQWREFYDKHMSRPKESQKNQTPKKVEP